MSPIQEILFSQAVLPVVGSAAIFIAGIIADRYLPKINRFIRSNNKLRKQAQRLIGIADASGLAPEADRDGKFNPYLALYNLAKQSFDSDGLTEAELGVTVGYALEEISMKAYQKAIDGVLK